MHIAEPGSYRGTTQRTLLNSPTNRAIRVYGIDFSVTGTATPNNTCMVLANQVVGITNAMTTATTVSTAYITVYYDKSQVTGIGGFDSPEGILFPNGVFIQTATSMNYYTITYSVVS